MNSYFNDYFGTAAWRHYNQTAPSQTHTQPAVYNRPPAPVPMPHKAHTRDPSDSSSSSSSNPSTPEPRGRSKSRHGNSRRHHSTDSTYGSRSQGSSSCSGSGSGVASSSCHGVEEGRVGREARGSHGHRRSGDNVVYGHGRESYPKTTGEPDTTLRAPSKRKHRDVEGDFADTVMDSTAGYARRGRW